jgi:hypothetical protein
MGGTINGCSSLIQITKNNYMKSGLVNLLVFVASTLGVLGFWKSGIGESIIEKGYGWAAYASAPLLALLFAFIISAGGKNKKLLWGVFALYLLAYVGLAYGVLAEF